MGQVYIPSLDRIAADTDEYPMPPCTQVDPELFTDWGRRAVAQSICRGCPVRQSCEASALEFGDSPPGVWGGLTLAERNKKKRRCQPVAKQ